MSRFDNFQTILVVQNNNLRWPQRERRRENLKAARDPDPGHAANAAAPGGAFGARPGSREGGKLPHAGAGSPVFLGRDAGTLGADGS